jgi:Trk K+ transport system NAD-binding subunit
VGEVDWPEGSVVVATTHRGRTIAARDETGLVPGDRITVLAPTGDGKSRAAPATAGSAAGQR